MSIKCRFFLMKAVKSPKNCCVSFRIPSTYSENNTYEVYRLDVEIPKKLCLFGFHLHTAIAEMFYHDVL